MQDMKKEIEEKIYDMKEEIKDEVEILLIKFDGNVLFPLRVMYKRNTNKMLIFVVMLILFMIFIFFKHLYNVA